jgi:hypothetical protein
MIIENASISAPLILHPENSAWNTERSSRKGIPLCYIAVRRSVLCPNAICVINYVKTSGYTTREIIN